jgi:hypothetical protein
MVPGVMLPFEPGVTVIVNPVFTRAETVVVEVSPARSVARAEMFSVPLAGGEIEALHVDQEPFPDVSVARLQVVPLVDTSTLETAAASEAVPVTRYVVPLMVAPFDGEEMFTVGASLSTKKLISVLL